MPKKKTAAQLNREIDAALRNIEFNDVEIAQMFKRRGSTSDSATAAILGDDPMYVRRFKMPKWNTHPTALQTVDVAIRHHNELGIPTSKHAHAARADFFRDLKKRFEAEHNHLLDEGDRAYGTNGPVISGGFHEDWPSGAKDKVRFVAQGKTTIGDAIQLHQALSKTRSPAFK